MKISNAEIEAAKSARGGWTRETLANWGVPWPPPKGWRKALTEGKPIPGGKKTPAHYKARRERKFRRFANQLDLAFKAAIDREP